jgi:nucleotide-binding universal stress UspA family protein
MAPFKSILVPVDFSPHSERAVEVAMEMAAAMGAEVHLLHVYGIPVGVAGPGIYDTALPVGVLTDLRDSAAKALEELVARFGERGVKVSGLVREGVPAGTIVDTAEEVGSDLIVMGTRGLSGLKHVLLGSVAERTLRSASCPVLAVPREDES